MDLSDLEHEASRILMEARAEASELIAAARASAADEAPKIREVAQKSGHEEGVQAGLEEGRAAGHAEATAQYAQALLDLTTRWSQTLDLLHQSMPAHAADAKTDLIRLALAIANRITHQQPARNPEVAKAIVEETLRMVGSARAVVLLANPAEVDMLQTYLPELLAKIRTIESVQLTPDKTISTGGCIVRFGAGQIDAQLETQIKRITDELLASD